MTKNSREAYLNSVAKIVLQKLDNIGVEYGEIKSFDVNSRAKGRFGQAQRRGGSYKINIMEELCDPRYLHGLESTIAHEVIHTCKGCMNHGEEWKRIAKKASDAYGWKITRTNSREEKGLPAVNNLEAYKYKVVCKGCGQTIYRKRRSDLIRNVNAYKCGTCHGKFSVEILK